MNKRMELVVNIRDLIYEDRKVRYLYILDKTFHSIIESLIERLYDRNNDYNTLILEAKHQIEQINPSCKIISLLTIEQ